MAAQRHRLAEPAANFHITSLPQSKTEEDKTISKSLTGSTTTVTKSRVFITETRGNQTTTSQFGRSSSGAQRAVPVEAGQGVNSTGRPGFALVSVNRGCCWLCRGSWRGLHPAAACTCLPDTSQCHSQSIQEGGHPCFHR